jgi:hypothetical protein
MRFCLLLMWGVTLSSSTLESIADEIQQNTRTTTRQLETDGGGAHSPEVTGTDPATAAPTPPPTGNDTIPGNGNPVPGTNDSGNPPANIPSAPEIGTPETDPCAHADVDNCAACKTAAASLTDNDKTCWWDGSSCSKTELEGHAAEDMCQPPYVAPTDPCATAVDSCEACKVAASSVTENDKTCWWENGTCSKVSTERDQGEMCVVQTTRPTVSPTVSPTFAPTHRPTSSPTKARVVIPEQNYPDEEVGFGATKVLAFVFFGVIIALAVRNRNFLSSQVGAGLRSSKQSGRYQEM